MTMMTAKEFQATRKVKTCSCSFQDRVMITHKHDDRYVTEMSYDAFIGLFNVRMADGETVTFRVAVIEQGKILAKTE